MKSPPAGGGLFLRHLLERDLEDRLVLGLVFVRYLYGLALHEGWVSALSVRSCSSSFTSLSRLSIFLVLVELFLIERSSCIFFCF